MAEDPSLDASSWSFPVDKPECESPFLDFMGFVDNKGCRKGTTFRKDKLLTLQPKHVLAHLTHKAHGAIKRKPEDRPVHAWSNHVKNIKMKLSHFMPSGAPWVDLPNGTGQGDPTRHRSTNRMIGEVIQFEIRGEGADSKDVRDMTVEELHKELELFRQDRNPICRCRNPLVGLCQVQFVMRCDDAMNFKMDDPKGHQECDFAMASQLHGPRMLRMQGNVQISF